MTPVPPDRPTCLVFPHEDADGPANMARDEAMLELVAADPRAATFRTYGWTEPTLSLGYFQSISEVEADPRWRGVPVVRRPTGGGAIVHDLEVTYALAVPGSHPFARHNRELFRLVHLAIGAILFRFWEGSGPAVGLRGHVAGPGPPAGRPLLCFADQDAADLVVSSVKVAGSAQRRRAGAILQHGSFLLARSDLAPELAGVSELARVPAPATYWAASIRGVVPSSLGFAVRETPWPDAILARAAEIERQVYRNPTWTRRR
jgi:lipoate-protein ligase A